MQVPQTAYSWALNEQLLQNAINIGNPIRDMNGGVNAVPGSALALERQLLSAAGWILQQAADGYYYWMKP